LYLTQSRALILLALLVIPFSKLILNSKISYRIVALIGIFFIGVVLYYIVPNYLADTRLYSIYQILFEGRIDGSTLTRIYIISESLSHLSFLDKIIGIGLGGFNEYFYQITGRIGHAAHNIYLQLFVEGGWIGLTLFVLLQIMVIFRFKENYKRTDSRDKKLLIELGLALFLGIEVLGFLLNAHYFYQSQILFMLILGYIISKTK
jgi:O-antigen ligase